MANDQISVLQLYSPVQNQGERESQFPTSLVRSVWLLSTLDNPKSPNLKCPFLKRIFSGLMSLWMIFLPCNSPKAFSMSQVNTRVKLQRQVYLFVSLNAVQALLSHLQNNNLIELFYTQQPQKQGKQSDLSVCDNKQFDWISNSIRLLSFSITEWDIIVFTAYCSPVFTFSPANTSAWHPLPISCNIRTSPAQSITPLTPLTPLCIFRIQNSNRHRCHALAQAYLRIKYVNGQYNSNSLMIKGSKEVVSELREEEEKEARGQIEINKFHLEQERELQIRLKGKKGINMMARRGAVSLEKVVRTDENKNHSNEGCCPPRQSMKSAEYISQIKSLEDELVVVEKQHMEIQRAYQERINSLAQEMHSMRQSFERQRKDYLTTNKQTRDHIQQLTTQNQRLRNEQKQYAPLYSQLKKQCEMYQLEIQSFKQTLTPSTNIQSIPVQFSAEGDKITPNSFNEEMSKHEIRTELEAYKLQLRQMQMASAEMRKCHEIQILNLKEVTMKELLGQLNILRNENIHYESKLSTLQSENAMYESKLSTLQSENAMYESKLSTLQSVNAMYQSKLSTLQNENAMYESKLLQLSFQHKMVMDRMKQGGQDAQSLNGVYQSLNKDEGQLTRLKEELEQARRQLDTSQREFRQSQAKHEKYRQESQQFKEKCAIIEYNLRKELQHAQTKGKSPSIITQTDFPSPPILQRYESLLELHQELQENYSKLQAEIKQLATLYESEAKKNQKHNRNEVDLRQKNKKQVDALTQALATLEKEQAQLLNECKSLQLSVQMEKKENNAQKKRQEQDNLDMKQLHRELQQIKMEYSALKQETGFIKRKYDQVVKMGERRTAKQQEEGLKQKHYQAQSKALEKQISSLSSINECYSKKVTVLELQLESLTSKYHASQEKCSHLQQKCSHIQQSYSHLQQKCSNLQQNYSRQQSAYEEGVICCNDLEKIIDKLKHDISEISRQHEKQREQQQEKASFMAQEYESVIRQLKLVNQQSRAEHFRDAKREIKESTKENFIGTLSSMKSQPTTDIKLEMDYRVLLKEKDRLEITLREKERSYSYLSQEFEVMRMSKESLYKEKYSLFETNKSLESQIQSILESNKFLLSQNYSLKQSCKSLQSQKQLFTETNKILESQRNSLSQSNKNVQSQKRSLIELNQKSQSQKRSLVELNRILQSEKHCLAESNKSLQSELTHQSSILQFLTNEHTDLKSVVNDYTAMKQNQKKLEMQIVNKSNSMEALTQEILTLKRTVENQTHSSKQYAKQVQQVTNRLSERQRAILLLNEQLRDHQQSTLSKTNESQGKDFKRQLRVILELAASCSKEQQIVRCIAKLKDECNLAKKQSIEYERLLRSVEGKHEREKAEIKKDYDVVYSKYEKYKAIAQDQLLQLNRYKAK